MNVDEALDIAIQVAEGLQEAHEKGIVHRDIKSANIMITGKGQAKITDFGLAKLAGQTSITETATIMGTVEYMSPEQARGDPVDHRTDIWSLGVVLYEMLTNRKPFDAENKAAVIHKIIYEKPPELESVNPDAGPALSAVVARAMAKDRYDRYANIGEFLEHARGLGKLTLPIATIEEKPSPSIAVLPFVNMSTDPDQEYFCDGLAEELINGLTRLKDLHVIARTSAFSFKGRNVNVRDIGRELDVKTILEGSVRKAGNKLRITAQLVDTNRGHHLWSERYDRDMEDVFAIQDEITLAIVNELKPKLLGEERGKLGKRQTVDLEAYSLYLKGRWFWNKMTLEGLVKAIGYFEKALEKAPKYALAYAGLADSYIVLVFYNPSWPQKESYSKARKAALNALEIDDTLAEAHTSVGYCEMLGWEWQGAEKQFRRAIELNPGYAFTHYWYAMCLLYMDRCKEAVREIERARELDPLSLAINREVGHIFFYSRQYDQAIEACMNMLEMAPNFPYVHLMLGFSYLCKSMYGEALAEFAAEEELSEAWNPVIESLIGFTYVRMGRRVEAQKILDHMMERSTQTYVTPTFIAILCFALGENNQGFEWLDKAYEDGDLWLSWLKVAPWLDNIRSDPRYTVILKKIGLDK
jgi:serine/threonine-protein kinase